MASPMIQTNKTVATVSHPPSEAVASPSPAPAPAPSPSITKAATEGEKENTRGLTAGLPTVLDIGGQLFDLKSENDVSSGFYGLRTFNMIFRLTTYGQRAKSLLRKYLYAGQDLDHIQLTEEDYVELMRVLRQRLKQLRESQEYQSNEINKIPIRRYEAGLLRVIETLKRGREIKKVVVPKLSENEMFAIILELSWYLAHPADLPTTIEKDWNAILENLRTHHRLGDIVDLIHKAEKQRQLSSEEHPLRYFRKLEMDKVVGAETLEDATQKVIDMTTLVQPSPISSGMRERLEALVQALDLKKYVDKDDGVNEDGIPRVNVGRLKQQLIANPMADMGDGDGDGVGVGVGVGERKEEEEKKAQQGGAEESKESKGNPKGNGQGNGQGKRKERVVSTLAVPLGQAILPVFRYFRMLFDPVYSMLEQASTRSVKRAILPHLLLLLHLCNELHSPPAGKRMEFGMYHLTNAPTELVTFLKEQLAETKQYITAGELKTEEQRIAFQKQLFHLPKVRLRSLVTNKGGPPTMTNEQYSIFHVQILVVGQNLEGYDETIFKTKNPSVDSAVGDAIRNTWEKDQVFLAFTRSNETEAIPFRFFEVDYEGLNVNETGITVGTYGGELATLEAKKQIPQDATVNKLAKVEPFAVYNDAELALSVLMALKERMPK